VSKNKHENITPDAFDLMAWIESGTVATRQVVIHNNPAMLAEAEALEAEYTAADKAAADTGGDAPMAAVDPRRDIDRRMKAWQKRWDGSRSTWTVRALAFDDIEATFDADKGGVPTPKRPTPPPAQAGAKAQEKFGERVTAWARAVTEADRERTLHIIAAAVTAIESPKGRLEREPGHDPIVTVEALRALRDRPHGEQWVGVIPSTQGKATTGRLAQAVMEATEGDVEVPRPTLPGRSTTLPG
jgi:hypothetical protein